MKIETLEEAASNFIKHNDITTDILRVKSIAEKVGFVCGAKWQEERSYGQKEVLELLHNREQYLIETVGEFYKSNIEWFEQFKKK